MKKKNLFYTLAASVMLAATAGFNVACTDNDNPVTPTEPETNPAVNELLTDFVKTVSGIEKYQQSQADYANPNELGLYDMSGNVWEWTSDWWADTADLVAEQGTDYAGPATGTVRTLSGGGWDYGAEYCAVSFRSYDPIDKAVNSLGFRLVLK